MRNQLIISLDKLAENYLKLKSISNKDCGAVVKAHGYGLGVKLIAERLLASGCNNFFVATLEEAVELRQAINQANIFVFHGLMENEQKMFENHNLIPVLNNPHQLRLWPKNLKAAIHIDTGMTRLGFSAEELSKISGFNIALVMSHLTSAEDVKNISNQTQLTKLQTLSANFPNSLKSLANSSGIFLGKPYHFDLCRPGIALYGGNPTPALKNPMQQVVKLLAPILQINIINSERGIGYNSTYIVKKGDITATIPLGYADGIMRTLSNHGYCYVYNTKLPIIGRVSMDLITIKINDLPPEQRRVGQMVEILGESYNICDMAKDAGTIEYEIITRLGNRFERIYV